MTLNQDGLRLLCLVIMFICRLVSCVFVVYLSIYHYLFFMGDIALLLFGLSFWYDIFRGVVKLIDTMNESEEVKR